jgi:hypothetical protein
VDSKTRKGLIWAGSIVGALSVIWTFGGKVHDAVWRHVDLYVVSEVEAAELQAEVKAAAETATQAAEAVTAIASQLSDYIERQDLKEERGNLERLNGELTETRLWESANGENAMSRARKADLERRIAETQERIRCLENPEANGC